MSKLREHAVELAKKGDYRTAFKMLVAAAEKGDIDAVNDIGVIAERHKNYDDAMEAYMDAHHHGSGVAARNIGSLYERGLGVKQDFDAAIEYYKIACERGYARAYVDLADMAERGHGMEKSEEDAFNFVLEGSKLETGTNKHCTCNLAYYYENGIGVKKDMKKAFHYYKEAAKSGYGHDLYNLGLCYFYGKGVKKDTDKGLDLLMSAAEQNYPDAFDRLARIYYEGKGVNKDLETSYHWLYEALDKGCKKSLVFFAEMNLTKDNPFEVISIANCVKALALFMDSLIKDDDNYHYFEDFKQEHIDLVDWDEFEKNPMVFADEHRFKSSHIDA